MRWFYLCSFIGNILECHCEKHARLQYLNRYQIFSRRWFDFSIQLWCVSRPTLRMSVIFISKPIFLERKMFFLFWNIRRLFGKIRFSTDVPVNFNIDSWFSIKISKKNHTYSLCVQRYFMNVFQDKLKFSFNFSRMYCKFLLRFNN